MQLVLQGSLITEGFLMASQYDSETISLVSTVAQIIFLFRRPLQTWSHDSHSLSKYRHIYRNSLLFGTVYWYRMSGGVKLPADKTLKKNQTVILKKSIKFFFFFQNNKANVFNLEKTQVDPVIFRSQSNAVISTSIYPGK